MKDEELFRITSVRLVEFHNLGTTTVDLPEGGHLFLLGDNGSGKTTLLDAIHLVLSAGQQMEFNSAARVAGARDSGGRTIQGIVLRYNAVTGRTARETGLTYAAVECRAASGKPLSFAIGLSADGLDVAYQSWGACAPVPVRDLPLTVEEDGRLRARTQAELKQAMASVPGGRFFARIGDYREAVADRLFGGKDKYADVCRLLRTGKAYREIAARATNYDDLFRQLLEDPSRETFEPLLNGLREIEESKGRLDRIDERTSYLNGLRRERDKLASARLKTNAVDWLEADAARRAAEADLARLADAAAAGEAGLKQLEDAAAANRAATEEARLRLADLRQKDSTDLLAREKRAAVRTDELQRKATAEAERLANAERAARDAAKARDRAREDFSEASEKHGAALQKKARAAEAPLGALTDALLAAQAFDATLFDAAETSLRGERDARRDAVREAQRRAEAAAQAVADAEKACAELRARGESLPNLAGYADVRRELRGSLLQTRSVFELVEPTATCDARHLALLERLIGEDFLATFLAEDADADNVRRIAWRDGASFAVASRSDCDGVDVEATTPWLRNYISYDESDPDAVRLLARQLAAKSGPRDDDFLALKTWTFRARSGVLETARPRLIGQKHRAAELARQKREAEDRLAACERAQKDAEKELAVATERLANLEALLAALATAQSGLAAADATARRLADAAQQQETLCATTRQLADERRRDADAAREELEDIRLKMREAGIDGALAKRLAAAERDIAAKEKEASRIQQEIGGVRGRLAALEAQRKRSADAASAATTRAEEAAAKFAAQKPAETSVRDFVCATFPDLAKADAADFAERHEESVGDARIREMEITRMIREPRGEDYAFVFEAEANRIADRRGVGLDDVIAEETRRLEELREALNRKNREVFERIFMGEVMRRLYIDLMQIEDLVGRIRRKLAGRRFGSNRYDFALVPVPEYEPFVGLVRRGYLIDAGDEKDELRAYLEAHRDEVLNAEIDCIPALFDYRNWFRFQLKVLTENEEGRVIDRQVKSMGSGGEQAVPNYLLILTVAEFLYHGGKQENAPRLAPMLFDEAFYGIDAARRDQLLAFADDLGLQLFVSSPDQDGVKREIRHSVSLIVIKDEHLDVHLSPVVWTNVATQTDLFGGGASAAPGMTILEETK